MQNLKADQEYTGHVLWLALILVPLWWALGVKLLIFHAVSLVSLLMLVKKLSMEGRQLEVPREALFLGLFIITYVLSVMVNMGDNSLLRSIASLYNLSFWLMGLAVILVVYHLNDFTSLLKVISGTRVLGIASVIFTLIALWLWFLGIKHWEISALIIKMLPGPNFAGSPDIAVDNNIWYFTTHLTVITSDWFLNRFFPRVTAFFLYPTALAAGMAAIIPLTWVYHQYGLKNKKNSWIYIMLFLIPLFFGLSRTVVIALFLAVLHQVFWDSRKKLLIIWLIFIFFFLLFLNLDTLSQGVFAARAGSSNLRFMIYQLTWEEALRHPFLGIGVKPRTGLYAPIGSHCTYLGILLKTGFLGLIYFLLFQFSVYYQWLKLKRILPEKFIPFWQGLGISFVSLSLWMFTDDLDAPHIVAFLYFIIIGCILWLKKTCQSEAEFDPLKPIGRG